MNCYGGRGALPLRPAALAALLRRGRFGVIAVAGLRRVGNLEALFGQLLWVRAVFAEQQVAAGADAFLDRGQVFVAFAGRGFRLLGEVIGQRILGGGAGRAGPKVAASSMSLKGDAVPRVVL